jgi:pyruvate kinase
MSGWQIGWIVLASGLTVALLVLSFFVLAKIGRLLDRVGEVVGEAQSSLRRATDEALMPIAGEAVTTMGHVNAQLVRVDTVTGHVADVTSNVSALTALFAATLGGPVVKAAAFSYGVRKAFRSRRTDEVERRVRAELKRERAGHRRRGAGRRGA